MHGPDRLSSRRPVPSPFTARSGSAATRRAARTRALLLALLLVLAAAGPLACGGDGSGETPDRPGESPAARGAAGATSTGDSFTVPPEDGEWPMQSKNYAGWRFSGLADIDTATVANLRQVWSFSTGTLRGHEGAPIVVDGTMYLVTPFPNIAYALDLAAPVQPTVKWKYNPNPSQVAIGKACCDVVNRGWALADGKLVYNLLDAHTIALDAGTGEELWRTKMDEVENGVTMTMPPLVVGNHVLVGNSGGEMGAHGWLAALDLDTGAEVWRAYATGPDSIVRIGPEYRPYYDFMRGRDLGVTTWPADEFARGGGASWAWITYDSTLNLVYYGTSNPSPWNPEQRPGYNLYTSAVLARDPRTGMARWAYQFTPHDMWDYDGTNENVLLTLPIDGRPRDVLVHFNRNAFVYVIDRRTGQVLSATPFAYQNWADSVNLRTGLPEVREEKMTWENRWTRDICPAALGAKNFPPSAWSPRTGMLYAPTLNLCMDYMARPVAYIAGTPYWGAETKDYPGRGGHRGALIAWDPVRRVKAWEVRERFPVHSGVLATAGDVVFYGTVEGDFKAVHARSGRVLWSQRLSSGIIGHPISYRGPDGKQYVAVYSGVGGVMGAFRDEPGFPPQGGTLHVFALP